MEMSANVRWGSIGQLLMLVIAVYSSVIPGAESSPTTSSSVTEFCQAELFEPTCAADEVVTIESAQYGRLNIGRCVTEDFGYLRCLHDVMPEVEAACSGRRSCRLRVDDVTFSRMTPCHRDLKSNLLASYRCTKVVIPNAPCKSQPGGESIIDTTTSPSTSSGFISSYVTEETGCGTADWPWTIRAGPGQRINLTLLDFSASATLLSKTSDGMSNDLRPQQQQQQQQQQHGAGRQQGGGISSLGTSSSTCRVYATIRDGNGGRSTTVCGGLGRTVGVFISATNRVEVRILGKTSTQTGAGQQPQQTASDSTTSYFLLRYDVLGCVDPILYPGMLMKRDGDSVTISCDVNTASAESVWQMTCVGNKWIGSYGNCTNGNDALASGIFSSAAFSYASPVIVIVVIAICVVCFILTVGTFCIRWRLRKDYSGGYTGEARTEPVDVIADYDYQYHTTSAHHQPSSLGISADKAGVYPIRGGRYPATQASYDTTGSAAILTGNEYATMRLLQLAPYTDVPTGVDQPYNGGRVSGCTMTEHIYESPDSMRRVAVSGDNAEDYDHSVTRQPYRMFDPSTTVQASGRSQWDQRSRIMQYQPQMTSAIAGGNPGQRSTAVTVGMPSTAAVLPGFNGERYEMPVGVGLGTGAGVVDQQRFTVAAPATGKYFAVAAPATGNYFAVAAPATGNYSL